MAEKVYTKGIYIKTRETSFGDVLKVSIKVDDFVAFVKANKNERGYLNLDILPRKEVSDKGESHYAVLDQWKPDGEKAGSASKPAAKPSQKKPAQKPAEDTDEFGDGVTGEDDIPF